MYISSRAHPNSTVRSREPTVLTEKSFISYLSYTDDVDLNEKLSEWERFHNFDRPHGVHNGKHSMKLSGAF
jgi:hypothetical protein